MSACLSFWGEKSPTRRRHFQPSQPSHDDEPPDGVVGDNAVGEGVGVNVATGNNSNKKRKSNRKKRDNAGGLGSNELHVTDGGNGGVDAPVDFFGIFNNEHADGIVEECGTADKHIVNDTSVKVVPESKKEIVLVSSKEDDSVADESGHVGQLFSQSPS